MLGLGGSITNRAKPPIFDFRKIKGLIGWWDFSNKSSIRDVASGPIDNGDYIYQIDNLAFELEKTISTKRKALGKFLQATDALNRPVWLSAGYAEFTSGDKLQSTISVGPIDTNIVSDSTISQRAYTSFFVLHHNSGTVSGASDIFFSMKSDNINMRVIHLVEATSDGYISVDLPGSKTEVRTASGQGATSNKFLLTTVKNSASSNKMYVNGDTSNGTSSGSAGDGSLDMAANSANVLVELGDTWAGRYHECVIFNRILDDREIKKVEKFLIKKHGI